MAEDLIQLVGGNRRCVYAGSKMYNRGSVLQYSSWSDSSKYHLPRPSVIIITSNPDCLPHNATAKQRETPTRSARARAYFEKERKDSRLYGNGHYLCHELHVKTWPFSWAGLSRWYRCMNIIVIIISRPGKELIWANTDQSGEFSCPHKDCLGQFISKPLAQSPMWFNVSIFVYISYEFYAFTCPFHNVYLKFLYDNDELDVSKKMLNRIVVGQYSKELIFQSKQSLQSLTNILASRSDCNQLNNSTAVCFRNLWLVAYFLCWAEILKSTTYTKQACNYPLIGSRDFMRCRFSTYFSCQRLVINQAYDESLCRSTQIPL